VNCGIKFRNQGTNSLFSCYMIPSLQDEALVIQPSRDAATSWDHMPLACTTEATGSKASKHAGGPLVLVDSFYTRIAK